MSLNYLELTRLRRVAKELDSAIEAEAQAQSMQEKRAASAKMTASEAVFEFAAWLTCRRDQIIVGAMQPVRPVILAAKQWLEENGLPTPDGGWPFDTKKLEENK